MISEKIIDNIYKLLIPLPQTPLKSLNVYVIRGERNLMIDTGFNHEVCYAALTEGMDELGLTPENTDIFLTHSHSDHAGLAWRIQRPGSKVYVSAEDIPYLDASYLDSYWAKSDKTYLAAGFSAEEMAKMPLYNVARALSAAKNCDFTYVHDDDILEYGGHRLRVMNASGHTPGMKTLFDEENGIMFLADHILFDITPNITIWEGFKNPLGVYMDALRRYKTYDIRLPFPGHRGVTCTAAERCDEILHHHDERLEETLQNVALLNGGTALDIAGHLTWNVKMKDKGDPSLMWFAVGETMAHLEYLDGQGKITRYMENGLYRYVTI
jgi:glyoxylase-like metal-dependent hydrolase (beta-lactamase superfamily II)